MLLCVEQGENFFKFMETCYFCELDHLESFCQILFFVNEIMPPEQSTILKISGSWKRNTCSISFCCSVWLFYTFWPWTKSVLYFPRYSQRRSVLTGFRRTRFFPENPASSVCAERTNENGSTRNNLLCRWVQKTKLLYTLFPVKESIGFL